MTRKSPLNSNPNVLCVRELLGKGLCKERSDGIAIVTLCVNRVQSQSLKNKITYIKIRRKTDEEQGNTHPKQNLTYKWYVILERMGVDAVICYLSNSLENNAINR